jgi:hypothetical protein
MRDRCLFLACGVVTLAFVFGAAFASCAPAELSGSDRVEGGTVAPDAMDDAKDDDTEDGCPTASDFYVDPSRVATACSTFSTIAAALQAARSSTAAQRTIHLAAGTYSDPADFPIDLRGGISLVGSGQDLTTLVGHGVTTIRQPRNAFAPLSVATKVTATILTGDPVKTSQISGLTIKPTPLGGMAGTEAIVCDRGNAATTPPSPNTLVSYVTVTGYEVGVRVTWSGSPLSGCNLSLTSSVIQNGWYGVVADGDDSPTGPVQTVSVQVGDLMEHGNTFVNIGVQTAGLLLFNGAAVATCDAVTGAVIAGNRFQQVNGQGDLGIWAVHTGSEEKPGFDIETNEFGPLTNTGVYLWGPVVVDKLLNNSFHDISMPPMPATSKYDFGGAGLAISADVNDLTSPFPTVRRVRGNTFSGNDVGVMIRSFMTSVPNDPSLMDFGTATDPGKNTFRCNSEPPGITATGQGADVFVYLMNFQVPANVVIPFEGNVWDHAPPTTAIYSTGPARGTDVWIYPDHPTLDTANATADADAGACPAGRVPGP